MNFRVYGDPAPQGSKRGFVRGGRVNLVESSPKVKPWREAVKFAALDAGEAPYMDGPVSVTLIFYMPRGTSIPKSRMVPHKKPDLDKLVRSTLDGITDAGMWKDDAQVVALHAFKVYANSHAPPGVKVTIYDYDPGGTR